MPQLGEAMAQAILNVVGAATLVEQSADDTGCSDDLTVCSKSAIKEMSEAIEALGEILREGVRR